MSSARNEEDGIIHEASLCSGRTRGGTGEHQDKSGRSCLCIGVMAARDCETTPQLWLDMTYTLRDGCLRARTDGMRSDCDLM
nr:hypothetical protein CFP56_64833 [Quercus suber]